MGAVDYAEESPTEVVDFTHVEHTRCGSQQWQATQVYYYILV
jgi:hypothetical protein